MAIIASYTRAVASNAAVVASIEALNLLILNSNFLE
jgi:hypothetical protein